MCERVRKRKAYARPLPVQDRDTSQHLSCAAGKNTTGLLVQADGGAHCFLCVCVCVCVCEQLEAQLYWCVCVSVLTIIIILKVLTIFKNGRYLTVQWQEEGGGGVLWVTAPMEEGGGGGLWATAPMKEGGGGGLQPQWKKEGGGLWATASMEEGGGGGVCGLQPQWKDRKRVARQHALGLIRSIQNHSASKTRPQQSCCLLCGDVRRENPGLVALVSVLW